jgi:hypothetical protein
MSRSYAALLAAALLAVVGCSADPTPAPAAPSPAQPSAPPSAGATASVLTAWQASDVRVRPDWVGADAPWVWKYSDDVVIIAPEELVALDRETGAEVWRLPLGGHVCGATPSPSKVGLVAVTVGRCEPATRSARWGSRIATGGPATARRTTVKGIDLESASVVWERPVAGAPLLDIGGEVLIAVAGCDTRRIDLSTGSPLGGLGIGCSDKVLAGDGVALVSAEDAPHEWRAIDVASGSTVASVRGPATLTDPRRILTADPLTVLAGSTLHNRLDLVRVDDSAVRVLGGVPSVALGAFASVAGDSLVFASRALPGATELSLDDGSVLGEFAGVGTAEWIPIAHLAGGVLGFEGTQDGLTSGHGRLTLRSLDDGSVIEVGELGGAGFRGETNLAVAAPKAVVIGGILLMPGHANARVLAYRLSLPED